MHIESGLGNQMLDYCDLLAEQVSNPKETLYIETILYGIQGACSKVCMWNGYELDRVFGIHAPNVQQLFSHNQWKRILEYVEASAFWEDNWRYSDTVCEAFRREGLVLHNVYSRPHQGQRQWRTGAFAKTLAGYTLKRYLFQLFESQVVTAREMYQSSSRDEYTGHTLQFCYKKRGIERIDQQLREAFTFPKITDGYNRRMLKEIKKSNSVAVHVRRGDMLSANGHYYKYGYFKRAVSFLKKKLERPVFYFFCDPQSAAWVKSNLNVFGLDRHRDRMVFVSGNQGPDSFRDMQLMAQCRHAVVTNSSFGFWGAYLNENKNKITCSPDIRINTTHSF